MKREFSAGGMVFNSNNQLLITKSSRGYWQFLKGHIEEGQTVEQAALREVREEGGVNARIIKKVGVSKYIRNWDGNKYHKTVTYFLMEYLDGSPDDHDQDVELAKWVDPQEALELLSFDDGKELLKKALVMIKAE